MRIKEVIQVLIEFFYPRRCPVCGKIITPRGNLICLECENQLIKIQEPRCKKCSKPIESNEIEYCYDCKKKTFHYKRGFSLWLYNGIMKKSISEFKFQGRREYSDFYVSELVKQFGEEIKTFNFDILVPVPLHKQKKRERGFNQAELLALGIGRELDISVLPNLLIREKKTLPQKSLNDRERLKNLEKAFQFSHEEASKYRNKIHKVLLVDDIYTTGSTIEACTNILLQNGVKEVYFISICIGQGY